MRWTELALGIVAALGSVATAYVIHVVGRVERQTNGYLLKLDERIIALEGELLEAQGRLGDYPNLPL